ncbi:sulfatase-like hydrolase/transferase [Fulvivirgaceae bacterium BMA12]|uniref:Sulfatase-like hydrolase/transferase n=1 Tax=Agaribacillus aureus TaxID=3051825 RepID=A0ABT8L7B0_9BACT|nr:sulfatase-like hydrolase/transferase [Fulvivirgaceae bacterium BMA12]
MMIQNTKNLLPLLLVTFLFTTTCFAQDDSKVNFVIIMADDLGYNDISCFGSTTINTPNLDQLASEGIKFTDFHSNGTVCSPTRAALITGKYQQRTGISGVVTAKSHRDVGLPLDELTFAEALRDNGYTTAMFGKWHVGYDSKYNPVKQGFKEFKGYVSGNVDYHGHIDQEGYFDWWSGDILKDDKGYSTDLITDYGVDFIKRNKDKPFLLYLPHESPHSPFQRRVGEAIRVEGKPGENADYKKLVKNKDSVLAIRKEMIEVMDEGIGRIISTLKTYGIEKRTLVLFCSDNGAPVNHGSNKPLRAGKGSIYEGGHRVPAIAWWPGKGRRGVQSDQTLMTMDIFPTLLDISKAATASKLDGISFAQIITGDKKLKKRKQFWKYKNQSAVRSGDFKLVSQRDKNKTTEELYNLKLDIGETQNIISDNPRIAKSLKKALAKWEKDVMQTSSLTDQAR